MEVGRLKYDIFFKKVFQQKHILKAFLNTVLEHELPTPIADLSYEPTDFMIAGRAPLLQKTKHDVIDVFCVTEQHERILIELQKGHDKHALPRFLDYQGRNYSSQFPTGADYTAVVPCYSICWFFDLKPPHRQIKEIITLRSNCQQTAWKFAWESIALYPQNIPKAHIEKKHLEKLEEWLMLDLLDKPEDAKNVQQLIHTKEVQEAFETLDLSLLSEEQFRRILFEEEITSHFQDLYEEKLRAFGEQSKKEQARAIAKQLLSRQVEREIIQSATGLTLQEIQELQQDG